MLFAWPANAPLPAPQRQTTRSPHGALALPCENCHTATAWRPIKAVPEFDHNKTKYPLRGMHEKVECTQCHVKPVFTNVGKNCQDCHTDIHQRKMGTNCADCHTVQGWKVAVQQVKDHQNRFPLLGAHAAVQCEDCHKGAAVGQFQGLSTACVSCHLKDYQQTQTMGGSVPNHVSAQFPQTCETCHTFDSWLGASMNVNHAAPPINFPLTNGHANVPCASCHVGGNYNLQIAATDCGNSQCHLTTWQQTTNPQHSAAATVFPIAGCSRCHNTVSWQNATFDHSTTGFPLANSHQMAPAGKVAACTDCHINNNYNLTIQPTDCANSQCHLTTWQQTNNPVHSAAGAPFAAANCSTCHNPTLWTNVVFNHAATGWPLTGSHQLAPAGKVNACTDCHINNNYTFTTANTDCFGCHQGAWQSTATMGGSVPNHITAGFPTSLCSQCHDTIAWTDSTFNHASTGFPLTNSHQIAPAGKVTGCDQCH
ncbi:MAG TPA: cytochrome c3 family protein, partial [Candidatus Acidoferrum sp.]